ncbi:TetR/AcrR family transcriptional regulator [Rhizorhabdus dicambivorans]|uniref:TetR/AcrR family transcriptional regulator n=1 Tax=Rhizorhabdus dicambivorans TaxID=1850238 RepID=A0A2A4FQX2_9SPHN|nr:TetR/AcrR family transcriptional regulator [Rhizorhabdus dicambivorans]PCE39848.1 TetR/AcrR family transcriptional regulator [Rhizorhabdus dicambivorans]
MQRVRSRPDEKRRAILDVATVLFRETGYERATMAEISARVGGSKATLYGYFKSKEELFVAAMIEALGEQSQVMLDLLDPSVPQVDRVLRRFGEAYLDFIMRPDVLAVTRAAVAEGAHVEVGALLYERGPKRGWEAMRAYLADLREKGAIRAVDPSLAAGHLKGMLEAGIVEPMLFGAGPHIGRKQAVAGAVEAFLRAYGATD